MSVENSYRPTQNVRRDFAEYISVTLNHNQYREGLELLSNSVTAGNSLPNAGERQTVRPLSEQLSLAATLCVHPNFTSRAKSKEKLSVSIDALIFLRNVLNTIGSHGADFKNAFACEGSRFVRPSPRYKKEHPNDGNEAEDATSSNLKSKFAKKECIFRLTRDMDVWRIIGWAFNCATAYPKRWQYWEPFVEFLCDLLERDLKETTSYVENYPDADPVGVSFLLDVLYENSKAARLRFIQAVFANGEDKSLREFPEIFPNETKELKSKEPQRKKVKIDYDKDKWGDYDQEDDEDDEDMIDDNTDENYEPELFNLAHLQVTALRARLFTIITKTAYQFPDEFTFYEVILDIASIIILKLPLEAFRDFIVQVHLPPQLHKSFLANMALSLLPNRPAFIETARLDQTKLSAIFIKQHANSIDAAENYKYSLLLEHLIMHLVEQGQLNVTLALRNDIEYGIRSRMEHAIGNGRKRVVESSKKLLVPRDELHWSGQRILAYIDLVKGSSSRHRLNRELSSITILSSPPSSVNPPEHLSFKINSG